MKPEFVCLNRKGDAVMYLPIPGPQPCPSVGGGDVISMDKHGQNFASADIARIRLRDVVKRDREAAKDGRWVKLRPNFRELMEWQVRAARNFSFAVAVDPLPPRPVTDPRPRYRYEVRR